MKPEIIKICGLTDPGNIIEVVQLQPDMIGMVFFSGSKRCVIDPRQLDFLNEIQDRPLMVGVFVDPGLEDIRQVLKILKLDAIQLHGSEPPSLCESLHNEGYIIIKAFGIRPGFDFLDLEKYRGTADYFLFDTADPDYGGTGRSFDWELLGGYHGETPFLLSGGISPGTLTFPYHVQFAGIDLNSRFENEPGIKNIELLKVYLKQIKNEYNQIYPR